MARSKVLLLPHIWGFISAVLSNRSHLVSVVSILWYSEGKKYLYNVPLISFVCLFCDDSVFQILIVLDILLLTQLIFPIINDKCTEEADSYSFHIFITLFFK